LNRRDYCKSASNSSSLYYIVCDIVSKIEEFAEFKKKLSIMPDRQGYIGYNDGYNAYIKIESFIKLINDTEMGNQIFFKKFGLQYSCKALD